MAVIEGLIRRNPDTGAGAARIRTLVQTISVQGNPEESHLQVVTIGNPDAALTDQLLQIDSEGRAKTQDKTVKASSLTVTEVSVGTTAVTVLPANVNRLKYKIIVQGEAVYVGPTFAAALFGPLYTTDVFEDDMWTGAVYAKATAATTIVVAEWIE